MRSIRGVLVAVAATVSACGPARSGAPEPATAETPQQKSPFTGEQRRWLQVYEQAGLPAITQAVRLEVGAHARGTFLPGWQLPGAGGRLLWDTLQTTPLTAACETARLAPNILRTSAPQGWKDHRCVASPPPTLQLDFIQELQARLAANSGCSDELAPPRSMRLDATTDRLVFAGDSRHGPAPGGLRWVAYAHWAHQLGRDDLAQSALAVAEEQLQGECPSTHCVAVDQLRAAAQRVLLHSLVIGLSERWMDWRDALDLAKRARDLAPSANTPIAEQARRVASQLELDLARDRWRREAASKSIEKLTAEKQVDAFLDVLADETGAGIEQVQPACAPVSPVARLVERAPATVPPLIALLEDDRLTRTRAPESGKRLPLLRVGEVALLALERIAGQSLRPSAKDLPARCRGPLAEDCWTLEARLAKAAAADWWNSAEQFPALELATRAARSQKGSDRLRPFARLRALDTERFAEVVGLASEQASSAAERAALLRLLRPEELAPIRVPADCDATAGKGWLTPTPRHRNRAASEWTRLERRVAQRLELSKQPNTAVNEVLASAVRSESPEVRLAAAQVLLAWGRTDAAFAIARDAKPRKRSNLSGPRLLRSIEYLLATGRAAAAETASELVDPTNLDTLAAARRGLTEAVLTARTKEQRWILPARARKRLGEAASACLATAWTKLDQPGALSRTASDWTDAWQVLALLQRGADAAPPASATVFDRLLDAQARLEAAIDGTDTKVPRPAWLALPEAAAGENAWTTVRVAHLRGKDSASGAAGAWLASLDGQVLSPGDAVRAFAELAQNNPGTEWGLHLVRHATGRGVTVLVSARDSQVAAPELSASCDGPSPCLPLNEPRVPGRAVARRLDWFAAQLPQRWGDQRDRTFEVVLTVAYPATAGNENCPRGQD